MSGAFISVAGQGERQDSQPVIQLQYNPGVQETSKPPARSVTKLS